MATYYSVESTISVKLTIPRKILMKHTIRWKSCGQSIHGLNSLFDETHYLVETTIPVKYFKFLAPICVLNKIRKTERCVKSRTCRELKDGKKGPWPCGWMPHSACGAGRVRTSHLPAPCPLNATYRSWSSRPLSHSAVSLTFNKLNIFREF